MPDTTPLRGWTYPLPTDKIAQGAAQIEAQAEGQENSFAIAGNKFSANVLPDKYPIGMSQMGVNDGSGTLGWPYLYGHVVTYLHGTGYAWQWFYQYSAAKVFLRQGITSQGTWKDWFTIANAGTPTAQAGGVATLTPPSGGGVVSAKITLPSGVFADQNTAGKIRIVTAANTTSPGVDTSANWATSGQISSFTLFLQRATATSTGIVWQAFQGGE